VSGGIVDVVVGGTVVGAAGVVVVEVVVATSATLHEAMRSVATTKSGKREDKRGTCWEGLTSQDPP
jgi:hypothetical protein